MSQPSWIGRSLSGRYQLESMLGQGGMSAVYKATDPNLKRVVAVKLIHSHLSGDPQFIQRFEEEAAAVASLRHPNIVQVFDFNSDQGVYYMVLEFIPGETLHDRLARLAQQQRQLPIDEAIKITLNVCAALGYAHKRGMIHRDIKPANIMLDVHGQAILMDFGIVKIIGNTSHTATGAVLGTARYISPEVIRSEPADQRSDIYSLGVTLFEMLSGRAPFEANSAMTLMMMHLNDPVPDPRSLRPDLPLSLAAVLLKSLEKSRENRYQSIEEMVADLNRCLAELEGKASPPPLPLPDDTTNFQTLYAPVTPVVVKRANNSAPPPNSPPPTTTAKPGNNRTSLFVWLGIGGGLFLVFLFVIAIGAFIVSRQIVAASAERTPTLTNVPTQTAATELPQEALLPSTTPMETATPAPSDTPEPTSTPVLPPLYVRINAISLNEKYQYVVDYETFGYTEKLPGMHVHFFFNTVPVKEAGMPGSGPWILYGGPRPFTEYTYDERPADATQMCALVANANHTVIEDSGNCFDLP